MKKEAAFSGLEAAIVLIAFVVVAAVFSYVMLGAGFFATQKSQEVTYSGIKQSTSNIVLDGQVYGTMAKTTGDTYLLNTLSFYLAIPEGGQPQKLADVAFLWTQNNGGVKAIGADNITFDGASAGSNVLAAGNRTNVVISNLTGPEAGGSFTLEIKPKVGASTLVAKTLATGYNGGVII